ncbi:MAG: peptidyl-prolyl cis-trans isomerase [Gammaproteobacteria bacterium]|nr:peptidyl-prolyl cis-trans isomerase [Gammaproteobacteria bacterium]
MKSLFQRLFLTGLLAFCSAAMATDATKPQVLFETNQGRILLELDAKAAPVTVENFLGYVKAGFYDGTIFHRVIQGFVIQGGGFSQDYTKKPTRAPIKNEAKNGLKNDRGTISMARTMDPNSGTSQFFINLVDNQGLNPGGFDPYGYAVFGKVIEGMETVDKIAKVKTGSGGPFPAEVPQSPMIITKATVVGTTK